MSTPPVTTLLHALARCNIGAAEFNLAAANALTGGPMPERITTGGTARDLAGALAEAISLITNPSTETLDAIKMQLLPALEVVIAHSRVLKRKAAGAPQVHGAFNGSSVAAGYRIGDPHPSFGQDGIAFCPAPASPGANVVAMAPRRATGADTHPTHGGADDCA